VVPLNALHVMRSDAFCLLSVIIIIIIILFVI